MQGGKRMKEPKYATFWCQDCGEPVAENWIKRHKCKKVRKE